MKKQLVFKAGLALIVSAMFLLATLLPSIATANSVLDDPPPHGPISKPPPPPPRNIGSC